MPSFRTGLWLRERQNDATAKRLLVSCLLECSFRRYSSACF
ncbi:hypothetical protein ACWNXI_14510 [Caldibacillus thermoamylovorans]